MKINNEQVLNKNNNQTSKQHKKQNNFLNTTKRLLIGLAKKISKKNKNRQKRLDPKNKYQKRQQNNRNIIISNNKRDSNKGKNNNTQKIFNRIQQQQLQYNKTAGKQQIVIIEDYHVKQEQVSHGNNNIEENVNAVNDGNIVEQIKQYLRNAKNQNEANNTQFKIENINNNIVPNQDLKQTKNKCNRNNNKTINLFNLNLIQLAVLFLSQLQLHEQLSQQCGCRESAVHRTVKNNPQIFSHLQQLKKKISQKYQKIGMMHNQDRFIQLIKQNKINNVRFAEDVITPYDHRALAMLLKRMYHKKYQIIISSKSKNIQTKETYLPNQVNNILFYKSSLQLSFYKQQYQMSVSSYYKQLLQLQLKYQRYSAILSNFSSLQNSIMGQQKILLPQTNFIRQLLGLVFGNKIITNIQNQVQQLEVQIETATIADQFIKNMNSTNINVQKKDQIQKTDSIKIQQSINNPKMIELNANSYAKYKSQNIFNKKEDKNQTIQHNILEKKQENYESLCKQLSNKQKQIIQHSLQSFKRHMKQVPYPYCMFLEYRLRSMRQASYESKYAHYDQIMDNDLGDMEQFQKVRQERKRFQQLNVYKGYGGYKTNNRLAENKRMAKRILTQTKTLSKTQQFSLIPNQQTKQIQQQQVELIQANKYTELDDDQVKYIPFPYHLSIFNDMENINKDVDILKNDGKQEEQNNSNQKQCNMSVKKKKRNKRSVQIIQIIDD